MMATAYNRYMMGIPLVFLVLTTVSTLSYFGLWCEAVTCLADLTMPMPETMLPPEDVTLIKNVDSEIVLPNETS